MHEKSRSEAVSEILDPACLAPPKMPRSKLFRSLVLSILTFSRTVTDCLDACLPALYYKPRPCDSLSVVEKHFCERGCVPNKLAGECIYKQEHKAFCRQHREDTDN